MAWTLPKTFAPNVVLTAAELNLHLRDNLVYLKAGLDAEQANLPERALVFSSGSITLPNGVWTEVPFNSEVLDSGTPVGIHDIAANTQRLVCRTAGLYLVWGSAEFGTQIVNSRGLAIFKNGAAGGQQRARMDTDIINMVTSITITALIPLIVGDYVVLAATQNSGPANTVPINAVNYYSPYFGMVRWAGT